MNHPRPGETTETLGTQHGTSIRRRRVGAAGRDEALDLVKVLRPLVELGHVVGAEIRLAGELVEGDLHGRAVLVVGRVVREHVGLVAVDGGGLALGVEVGVAPEVRHGRDEGGAVGVEDPAAVVGPVEGEVGRGLGVLDALWGLRRHGEVRVDVAEVLLDVADQGVEGEVVGVLQRVEGRVWDVAS